MQQSEVVISILSDVQIEFIKTELGFDKTVIKNMDNDAIDNMYDSICDIEVEETVSVGDNDLSERGKIAAGIVTLIGNELYSDTEEEN